MSEVIESSLLESTLQSEWDRRKELEKDLPKAMRFNEGKLQWSLVHFASLHPMVKVLMFGAQKYDAHNWKKGQDKMKVLESMMRHLTALIDGERDDPENGLPHIGHIQCNCMFYAYFDQEG